MRTAIFFLIGVAVIAVIGSIVPQAHTSAPQKVSEFLTTSPNLNALLSRVGLPPTEVFVSPAFFLLLGSLFVALGACVLRRGRALLVRTARHRPRTPQFWGEWGSWLFHTSFFLLVVAAIAGKATGFQGLVAITEGGTFTEARSGYDDLQEGILFGGHHSNAAVTLNHFKVGYQPNGEATDYVSNLSVIDHGKQVLTQDVRVNEYMSYGDVAFYQQDYGWAPDLVVRNPAGVVVHDSPVQLFGSDRSVQTGTLKVPDLGYRLPGDARNTQLGARLAIFPDAHAVPHVLPDGSIDAAQTTYKPGGFEARNPVVMAQLFLGDLGIDGGAAQNVSALDVRHMQPFPSSAQPVPLALGDVLSIPVPAADGTVTHFTVGFTSLKQYSLFLVKRDGGVGLVYLSFVMMLSGLMIKLYVRPILERSRRR